MNSITLVVRWREPNGTRTVISDRQLRLVPAAGNNTPAAPGPEPTHEDKTLAERVFLFLEQRSA